MSVANDKKTVLEIASKIKEARLKKEYKKNDEKI
jgi:hypothetical protein